MAEKTKSKIKLLMEKLKKKEILLAVAVVIVMLIIYFSSIGGTNEKTNKTESIKFDYCSNLQTETQNVVKKISGDKNAKVVIGWEGSIEEVIAYSVSTSGNTSTSSPVIVQTSRSSGPIVLKQIYPNVIGVVVVFDGGNDTKKKLEIMEMVSTLLGISPEKVAVYATK